MVRIKTVGKYEVGETLGFGEFAVVKEAKHKETGRHVAIKIIDRKRIEREKLVDRLKKEITIMRVISHPYIANLIEVLATETDIYLILELCEGGELFEKILLEGKFSESEARKYFQQLIEAVDYCHKHGISHRDLKPENLLLDKNLNLKISDFGLSLIREHSSAETNRFTITGTPNYVAPEVLVIGDQGYDVYKADIWSCGVILFVFLAGYLPFDEESLPALFRKIIGGEYEFPDFFSESAKELISNIIISDVDKRWTIKQIRHSSWYLGESNIINVHELTHQNTQLFKKEDDKTNYDEFTNDEVFQMAPIVLSGASSNTDLLRRRNSLPDNLANMSKNSNNFLSVDTLTSNNNMNITTTTPSSSYPYKDASPAKTLRTVFEGNDNKSVDGFTTATDLSVWSEENDDDFDQRSNRPITMTAFDLVAMVAGASLSRMFNSFNSNNHLRIRSYTQFSSTRPATEILLKMSSVLNSMKSVRHQVIHRRFMIKIKASVSERSCLIRPSNNYINSHQQTAKISSKKDKDISYSNNKFFTTSPISVENKKNVSSNCASNIVVSVERDSLLSTQQEDDFTMHSNNINSVSPKSIERDVSNNNKSCLLDIPSSSKPYQKNDYSNNSDNKDLSININIQNQSKMFSPLSRRTKSADNNINTPTNIKKIGDSKKAESAKLLKSNSKSSQNNNSENKYGNTFSKSHSGIVRATAQIFELPQNSNLVVFRRTKGSIIDYHTFWKNFQRRMEEMNVESSLV